jgi:transcriptional regulator with XRE-family HTH domain
MTTNWPKVIREAREFHGESQAEFAKRFKVSTNTVSRWETGTYKPSLVVIDWILDEKLFGAIKTCPTCGGKGSIKLSLR